MDLPKTFVDGSDQTVTSGSNYTIVLSHLGCSWRRISRHAQNGVPDILQREDYNCVVFMFSFIACFDARRLAWWRRLMDGYYLQHLIDHGDDVFRQMIIRSINDLKKWRKPSKRSIDSSTLSTTREEVFAAWYDKMRIRPGFADVTVATRLEHENDRCKNISLRGVRRAGDSFFFSALYTRTCHIPPPIALFEEIFDLARETKMIAFVLACILVAYLLNLEDLHIRESDVCLPIDSAHFHPRLPTASLLFCTCIMLSTIATQGCLSSTCLVLASLYILITLPETLTSSGSIIITMI